MHTGEDALCAAAPWTSSGASPRDYRQHQYKVSPFEPFVAEEVAFHSHGVDRLYRPSKSKILDDGQKKGSRARARTPFSTFELILDALPTVSFALSAVGALAAISALGQQGYEFAVPSVLAALGFGTLGAVSCHIRTLIRNKQR